MARFVNNAAAAGNVQMPTRTDEASRPFSPVHGPHGWSAPPSARFEWACPHPCCGLQASSRLALAPLDGPLAFMRDHLVAAGKSRLLALLEALR